MTKCKISVMNGGGCFYFFFQEAAVFCCKACRPFLPLISKYGGGSGGFGPPHCLQVKRVL